MIDYNEMRKKFKPKDPKKAGKRAETKQSIKKIAREYEQKRTALGLDGPKFRRTPVYYMILILIMIMIAAAFIGVMTGNVSIGKKRISKADIQVRKSIDALAQACGRYKFHVGRYPTEEEGLAELARIRPELKGWAGPYVKKIVPDPWGHDYVYGEGGAEAHPVLYSKGPDGRAGTTDDVLPDQKLFDEPFRDTSWTKHWVPYQYRGILVAPDETTRKAWRNEVKKYWVEGDTRELQAKIDAAWRAGGGEVVIPEGDHKFNPIRLRSGVRLRLARHARVYGNPDANAYVDALAKEPLEPVSRDDLLHASGENLALREQYALFYAFRAQNVEVVGEEGSFVNGMNCPDPKGGEGYRGPHTFSFACSTNIVFRGVRVEESGDYAFKFINCANVMADGVAVEGGHDGVHFDLCTGVRVLNAHFYTGDDSVAGSGCTDIVVSNCVLNSACSPFRLGGRDVLVTDCRAFGPARHPHRWTLTRAEKLRGAATSEVKGRRTVGAFYQGYTGDVAHKDFSPGNIVVRNTTVENVERFMLSVSGLPGALWQDGKGIPDITFENVVATGVGMPSAVVAKKDCPMKITLRNCSFAFRTPQSCAFFGRNVTVVDEGVKLTNAKCLFENRPGVSYDDVPDFPSWRIESDEQRAKWGLPPLTRHKNEERVFEVGPGKLTPIGARDAIRAARTSGYCGACRVRVKAGVQKMDEPLVFAPCDSGTPDAPVVWEGELGAVLAGGEVIANWTAREDGLWEAPAPRDRAGKPIFLASLYVDGRRIPRARIPETGYLDVTDWNERAITNAAGRVTYRESVVINDPRVDALAGLSAVELAAVTFGVVVKWSYGAYPIDAFDAASRTFVVSGREHIRHWKSWVNSIAQISLENVRAGLAVPDRWFCDAKEGKILYRPKPGASIAAFHPTAPTSELVSLVQFEGDFEKGDYVHDIAFRDLAFALTKTDGERLPNGAVRQYQMQAAVKSGGAIVGNGAHRISFENCSVRDTENYGLWFERGCVSNRVVGCTFTELGAGGIWFGDRRSNITSPGFGGVLKGRMNRMPLKTAAMVYRGKDATAHNVVENCDISVCGRFNPEGCGVVLTHVSDSSIVHCDIHDLYYTGVSVGWVWGYFGSVAQRNTIAFNRIWDVGKHVMADMGGIYTLGASYGTAISNNVIHAIDSFSYGGWGLYNDEGSEGIVWENNLVYDTTSASYHIHYGRNNLVRNNILADSRETQLAVSRAEVHEGVRFERNLIYWSGEQKYPGFKPPDEFYNCTVPLVGWGTNLFWNAQLGAATRVGVKKPPARMLGPDYQTRIEPPPPLAQPAPPNESIVVADPLFVDPGHGDFSLRPDSPAASIGFVPWNASCAGFRR